MQSLTFLTWNLAMFQRSASAPLLWDTSNTEAIARETVLKYDPDIVLYQELPGMVPFVETHAMIKSNPRTHSGNLATLVRNELAAPEPQVTAVDRTAVLATFPELELTIANVHLAPGKGAAADRLMQLSKVIEASPTKSLLIAGDTNMRLGEEAPLVEGGFTGDKPPHVTWDSRRNRFREAMPEFSAYFTRWIASPGVTVSDVHVHRDPVEVDDHRFFISDHYALSGTVTLTRQS